MITAPPSGDATVLPAVLYRIALALQAVQHCSAVDLTNTLALAQTTTRQPNYDHFPDKPFGIVEVITAPVSGDRTVDPSELRH